ncbi:hypothetical protein Rhe02_05400 [Rhizocola hellebori]|uniref:Uncharacterized protein n=1 Tax=Rhizocola hellebori TaxID=1392758 RepID=A0A8J3VDR0_9ACTN|nr:hypothetical protein [Rhizocola hellebori]GIH02473.1 hypothetical protein Rhe02_05400 [Rhizocola hellebori]
MPAALLLSLVLVTLNYFGVPYADLAKFVVYLAFCVTIPGTLIWRSITRRVHAFGEEAAAGTALGIALEVLTYIPARAVGVPLLVLVWPLVTMLSFGIAPGLRRYWRATGSAGRAPMWHSWAICFLLGLFMVYITASFFRESAVDSVGYTFTDTDSAWYLAIVGELKHHMPPMVSYAPEGPLKYHWFVFADMAAASWITGIEPFLLLRRLSLLPYFAVLALLVPAITRRLTRAWWTGPVALLVTFFVLAPHPFKWLVSNQLSDIGFDSVLDASLLRTTLWLGPPITLAAALFAAVVLLLVELLGAQIRGAAAWLALTVLLVAVSGAKATFIPLLLAGLGCVLAVGLLRRKVSRVALIATGIALASAAFSMLVLLGGSASGLVYWPPLQLLYVTGFAAPTRVLPGASPLSSAVVMMLGISVLCWAGIWGGLIGLRRDAARRPEVLMFVGIGVAGTAAALLFSHPGLSQDAFFQGMRPYLSIAAVVGLAAMVTRSGLGRRLVVPASIAAATGLFAVLVLRGLGSSVMPRVMDVPGSRRSVMIALAWPYLVLVLLVITAAVFLFRSARTRAAAPVLLLAMGMGMGLETALHDRVVRPVKVAMETQWQPNLPSHVSQGSREAGRWIRDHSAPSDVVATNAHCLFKEDCANVRFTATAFSERRVLIEGWGYQAKTLKAAQESGSSHFYVPYWNPDLLAVNDAAFITPSAQTLGRLRDQYGVRWLFVDRSISEPAANLGEFARLRFSSGFCDVYEVLPAA